MIKDIRDLIPSSIHNKTFGSSEVILSCFVKTNILYKEFGTCEKKFTGIQAKKTANYYYVCYNFKHLQFTEKDTLQRGVIYKIWLYHHVLSDFTLFLTSDYNEPNGQSFNSLKLTGKFFLIFCVG